MIKIRSVLLILLLVGGSCGRNDDPSLPVPRSATSSTTDGSESMSPDPASCERVTGGADREADTHAFLRDVRASDRGSSDRIVFEFSPPDSIDPNIPRFEIEEVNPPFTDESDKPMQVEGRRFFRVTFFGGTGVDETYTATYQGPKEMRLGLPTLKEAEQLSDFEATLSWVMGLGKLRCPQITQLRDPLRVAIDFAH